MIYIYLPLLFFIEYDQVLGIYKVSPLLSSNFTGRLKKEFLVINMNDTLIINVLLIMKAKVKLYLDLRKNAQ